MNHLLPNYLQPYAVSGIRIPGEAEPVKPKPLLDLEEQFSELTEVIEALERQYDLAHPSDDLADEIELTPGTVTTRRNASPEAKLVIDYLEKNTVPTQKTSDERSSELDAAIRALRQPLVRTDYSWVQFWQHQRDIESGSPQVRGPRVAEPLTSSQRLMAGEAVTEGGSPIEALAALQEAYVGLLEELHHQRELRLVAASHDLQLGRLLNLKPGIAPSQKTAVAAIDALGNAERMDRALTTTEMLRSVRREIDNSPNFGLGINSN